MAISKEKAKETLTEFIGDGNDEEIDALLDEASKRERQIDDDNLITRDNEDDTTEDEEEEDESEVEVVLDDLMVDKIVDTVSERIKQHMQPQFDEFENFKQEIAREIEELNTLVTRMNGFIEEEKQRASGYEKRFSDIEKTEENKVRDAVDDLPTAIKRKITVSHRPSTDNNDDDDDANTVVSLRDRASATLENLNVNDDLK